MNTAEDRITVYDGNCRFCKGVITTLTRWKWIDISKTEAYYDMAPDKQSKIDLQHFRSEMAIIDMNGGRTLYGLEGVLYSVGYRFPFLRKIKREGFIFPFLNFLYKNIAWNRYVIMTPASPIKCDCEPPLNKFYRLSLFSFCVMVAIIISALKGLALGKHLLVIPDPVFSVTMGLLIVGTGWMLQLLIARIALRGEMFYDYLGHIGIIMLTGVTVLIPALALFWLPDVFFYSILGISVLISSIVMFRMHYKRVAAIGLSQKWTLLWAVSLFSTASVFSYIAMLGVAILTRGY